MPKFKRHVSFTIKTCSIKTSRKFSFTLKIFFTLKNSFTLVCHMDFHIQAVLTPNGLLPSHCDKTTKTKVAASIQGTQGVNLGVTPGSAAV